jgi:DNA modification methylase
LLDSPDFKEDSVREELILPILKFLGYSPSGKNRILRSKKLTHPFVKTGSGDRQITNFPDYLLKVDDKYGWTLDAKGPDEEIKTGGNVEQTYFYAIHPDIRVQKYALCNGREFAAFDTYSGELLLYFHLSEIEQHWEALERVLGPAAFEGQKEIKAEPVRPEGEFDYKTRTPLDELKSVGKQTAKRHFGVHAYFTRQAYRVVQAYIKNFTKPDDLILDPFGGGGVTLIEALMLGRRAIHIDLNPLSVFIVENLIQPIDPIALLSEFERVRDQFNKHGPRTKDEIARALNKYPHPKGIQLMKNADVDTIEKLWSPAQLAQLAYLKHLIGQVKNDVIRNQLMLAFSSSLNKFNLTFHYTKAEGGGGGDSSAFRYYRFRIAPDPGQNELMKVFAQKLNRILAAKKEMAPRINEKTIHNAKVYKGTATRLRGIDNESIDYIYTDPPYGAKIPYLDLSIMWTAWLDLPITEKDYQLEAIEGGEHHKSKENYSDLISQSIKEMYRVLKFDRWMSFVFAHKDPQYWHLIVETAEKMGFEYAGAVQQRSGQSSFKKRQNPFTVLYGQLIINFKKVKNPKSIMKVDLGADITDIIIQTIEGVIAKNHGATVDEINDELILRGLEMGFLDILSTKYQDLTPFLFSNFDYDEPTQKYHLRKDTKFKAKIDVKVRLRYYLISYLRRMVHQKRDPTFDEIVLNIMPLLKNGETPKDQTILHELEKLAIRVREDRWRIAESGQQTLFESH